MRRVINKIFIISVVFISTFVLVGCGKTVENNKSGIEKYNGVYKKGKNKFYLVATSKNKLEYCSDDKEGIKICGYLDYENGTVKNDADEVKIKLDNNKLNIKTSNSFKGSYKLIKNFTLEEYYNYIYGLDKYYNSSYLGKYVSGDNTIYIYQPTKKYVRFIYESKEEEVSCDPLLQEENSIECEIFDTKYTIKFDGDKVTYAVKSKDKNYEETYTKESDLTKKQIINIFDPFYSIDE